MSLQQTAKQNLRERLADNPYPGRGLILGMDDKAHHLIQVYWIMGRSENSRNRVFVSDGKRVWTEPADPARVEDPSLIIYNAMRETADGAFVVSNGDQTDTICEALEAGATLEKALATRECEPDHPHYTSRISGVFDLRGLPYAAIISLLRHGRFGDATDRFFWRYEEFQPGYGYCITTYMGDGNPLPAFQGEPFLVPLVGDMGAIACELWSALNPENKVSLCVKAIDPESFETNVLILNKHEKKP